MASDVAFRSQFTNTISFLLPFWMCSVDISYQVLLLSQSLLTSVCDHKNTSLSDPQLPKGKRVKFIVLKGAQIQIQWMECEITKTNSEQDNFLASQEIFI